MFTFFFFNDTATTEIYTLSLHDALPIYLPLARHALHDAVPGLRRDAGHGVGGDSAAVGARDGARRHRGGVRRQHDRRRLRSEEHTSELQSRQYLVCRLLLEKKKTNT